MIVPDAAAGKALFIIDVQPLTFEGDVPHALAGKIARYIEHVPYDAYVLAEYHAPPSSMFEKQQGFTLTEDAAGATGKSVLDALRPCQDKVFHVKKTARSRFKGKNPGDLCDFLARNEIEEAHFVGFDINDCVLASAYEAIDRGYYSFILEELCHHYSGLEELKEAALTVLRRQNMTNNSLHAKIKGRTIDLED